MRKSLLLLLFAGMALPGLAAKRVTVQQLEQLVAAAHGRPDSDAAGKLSEVELTERLSAARAGRLGESVPGPMTREALLVLADTSAFLRLPANEIPATTAPAPDVQGRFLDSASQFAGQTLTKLPNFFATRETNLFMDAPARPGKMTVPADQSLQPEAKSSATVLYRDGKQVVETGATNGKKPASSETGLITSGEFGPILGTVLADARQGQLAWSHWEQGPGGQEAVFRYTVPREKSHYELKFCCVSMNSGREIFQRHSGYHGEITIDPETGAILRLTMQADLKPAYPLARADLMMEYGAVEIGGKTYTCPVKSVAIARGYEPVNLTGNVGPLDRAGSVSSVDEGSGASDGPEILQTMLNHVVFRQYHLFRSDARILTDDGPAPDANPPASAPPNR